MILKIVQVGDPVLRTQARELTREEILSPSLEQLIELMRETMRDAPGVGLAAPQVGLSLQLAVIEDQTAYHSGMSEDDKEERGRSQVPFHVIINPRVTIEDPAGVEFYEGCLSLTGFSALVPRASEVRVEALNHRAEPVAIHAHGWYARILQHETDHLRGKLYIDRMRPPSFTSQQNYHRYWAELSIEQVISALQIEQPSRPA